LAPLNFYYPITKKGALYFFKKIQDLINPFEINWFHELTFLGIENAPKIIRERFLKQHCR